MVAFLLGVAISHEITRPWLDSLPWLVATSLLLVLPRRFRIASVGWFGVGVAFGVIFLLSANAHRPPAAAEGRDMRLVGRVVGLPERDSGRERFLVEPESLRPYPRGTPLPRLVRLSWYSPDRPAVRPGERWALPVRLKRPRGFANPVRFDYERYLAARGIDATGYVHGTSTARRLGREAGVDAVRAHIARALRGRLGNDDGAAIVRALVVGDRRAVSDSLWSVLRASGTAHLVAISGLHVGLVAGLVWLLTAFAAVRCRPLTERFPARSVAAVAGLAAVTAYAALAGFSLPTTRALVMLALVTGLHLLRRPAAPLRVLLLAACAVVIAAPSSMLGSGFWLSFAAVALVLHAVERTPPGTGALTRMLRLQATLTLGLAPLTLLLFGNVSLLSFPVNLLAIPLFSLLVVPAALIGTCLGMAGVGVGFTLLEWLAGALDYLVHCLQALVAVVPGIPGQAASGWTALAVAAAVAALALRPLASSAVAMLLLSLVPALSGDRVPDGLRVTALDVGQGNAVVVRTRRHTLVYDTGPAWRSGAAAARFTMVPYLQQHAVTRIDRLVVSHKDIDHSGGTRVIDATFAHGPIWSGEPLPGFADARRCREGQHWRWDGVRFRVLWPPAGRRLSGNASSCVLLVAGDGIRVLLTGDIQKGQERAVASRLEGPVDILQVPHHGSRTSSSPGFVARAHPRIALISAGYHNRYGLPAAEVVRRYKCAGARVLNTAIVGAVTVRASANGVSSIHAWRTEHGHLYNDQVAAAYRGFRAGGEFQYDSSHPVEPDCRLRN